MGCGVQRIHVGLSSCLFFPSFLLYRFREAIEYESENEVAAVMLEELGNCLNEVADQNVLRLGEMDALFEMLVSQLNDINVIVAGYSEVGWITE